MLPIGTILHPTDFSEHADNAYRVARMVARESGARLIVLHVAGMHVDLTPVVQVEMGLPLLVPKDYRDHDAHLRDRLRERTDPVGQFLREEAALKGRLHGVFDADHPTPVETRLEHGEAFEEILRVAGEVGCDLIVMGTHGRTGIDRLLLGSVAEQVLRRARCPVLTVKSPIGVRPQGFDRPSRGTVTKAVRASGFD